MKQAVLPARKRTKRVTAPPKVLRADIQGLRAFAVIVVVLDHLFGWPSGGFVGVDIFLVISGFLITGHLMREWEKKGTLSFVNFYKRRIKRILPAATLVIVFTVVVSFLLFTGSRAWSVFWDGVWATFFSGNWRFATAQTDYFQADGPVSPLQHFWSLGVEEQFYFVWPWLMLGALALMARSKSMGKHPRVTAGVVIFAITAASFAWAMHETTMSPTVAYFSTFSRAWELGIGALLALLAPACNRINDAARPALAWAGVAGMVVALFLISPESAFPGPWAALPVVSSGLFILAGTGGRQRFLAPFTNPFASYLGDISYSLYLWHFPVIVFMAVLLPDAGITYFAGTIAVMLLLSVFSYHLVEDPIRNSNWLITTQSTPTTKWKYSDRWLAFLGAVTAIGIALTFAYKPSVAAGQVAEPRSWNLEDMQEEGPKLAPEVQNIQDEIKASLAMSKWPELTPGEDSLGRGWFGRMESEFCLDVDEGNVQDCYFPTDGADKTAVVYGDSHAIAWFPGLKQALSDAGYNVQMLTRQMCAAADIELVRVGGEAFPECTEHRTWAVEQIERLKPDAVFMSSAPTTLDRLASEAKDGAATKEYSNGLSKSIKAIASHTEHVVVMSSPPDGASLESCRTNLSKPADCQVSIRSEWKTFVQNEKQVAKANDTKYVDSRLWFCSRNEVCPIFVDGTLVRGDDSHLTIEYSVSLAPVIRSEVIDDL